MDMNNMLSHAQVTSAIKAFHASGVRRTIYVQGENGIGKTACVMALRNDPQFTNHIFVDPIDATQMSDGSVWMPDIDREAGVSRELPNERFGLSKTNRLGVNGSRPVVVFLDEVDKAPQYIQNVLAPIMYDYRVGDYHFPEGSLVIAASNLGAEGLGDSTRAHIRSRRITVQMRKPTQPEWKEYAINKGLDYRVIAATSQYPSLFDSFLDYEEGGKHHGKTLKLDNPDIYNPRETQDSYASPRTFEASSDIVRCIDMLDAQTLRALLWGAVGVAAEKILTVIRLGNTLPDYMLVCNDPTGAPLVSDPIAQVVQVQQFVSRAKSRDEAAALTTYVMRMPREEHKQLFINQIANSSKVTFFYTVEPFNKMLKEYNKFVNV